MKRAVLLSLAAVAALRLAAAPAVEHQRTEVMVPMRDGVRLSTHVFRMRANSGPAPVLLVRTPYGKGADLLPGYHVFLESGYVVVVQDVRGRFGSEGYFRPPEQERNDGYDTLNWIAAQPWSNGRIGMLGGSYLGIVQWQAALSGNPHLKAIFPVVSGADDYRDRFYSAGGAMKLGHRLSWMADNLRAPGFERPSLERYIRQLPLRTIDRAATGRTVDFFQRALDHPSYDAYWRRLSTREQLARISIPVFLMGGWYDNFVTSDLDAFAELTKRSKTHRIVVGPWAHSMSAPFPKVSFGPEAASPVRRYQREWFDHWVKPSQPRGDFPHAPVRIFVMGANRWREEREWPLARTRYIPLYLASRGNANTASGNGSLLAEPQRAEMEDEFTYDPRNPVPTAGGAVCCNPRIIPWGPMDQRRIEERPDVLVFTSPVLKRDVEVTGQIRVVLYVATSATDTDFTAKLVDVFPDGEARNLTDGILRLRYRRSLEQPAPVKPGEIYSISIDAGVTSNLFRAGHRIRIEVSSSNFPRFDRNPNTGRPIADETELRAARQTVYHGRRHPSQLILPVVNSSKIL